MNAFSQDLFIKLTYPASDDTFYVDRLRLAGSTHPKAALSINNKAVPVFRNGAFVSRIDLEPGWNEIQFSSTLTDSTVKDTLRIFHIARPGTLSQLPTKIDTASLEPGSDVWLLPGDKLNVRMMASPGGRAIFSIEDGMKNIPMTELPSARTNGIEGIYHGVVQVDDANANKSLEITVEFKGVDGEKVKLETPGRLYVMTDVLPLVGMTREKTYLWNSGKGGTILGEIPDSVYLHIVGRVGGRNKIKLSRNRFAYINAMDIHLLPVGTPLPEARVSTPSFSQNKDWYKLTMAIGQPLPFLIHQYDHPLRLELTLFGARQDYQWITYPNHETPIQNISWLQEGSDMLKIVVELEEKQLWGYKLGYDDHRLILAIRKPPSIPAAPASALQNVVFVIDAGHGGEELGAISSTGIMEKEVNLKMARALYRKFEQAGAKVFLTRQADTTLSLQARLDIARSKNAHVFLCLHNNSIGPSSDPIRVRGTSVYYYNRYSKGLAWAIYPHLVDLGLAPFGRVFTPFYVTRATDMISVLVEGIFMSNPEDEMIMQADEFAEDIAIATFKGVNDFFKSIQGKTDDQER